MEDIIALCRAYPYLTLFVLYFTVGRFSLLLTVVLNIAPLLYAVLIIYGIEIIQIPFFYHFFAAISGFSKRMQERYRIWRKKPEAEPVDKKESFFIRHFRKYGQGGVLLLAGLPFKGCGVWTSILLGRTLGTERKRLYLLVLGGTLLGNSMLILFGLLFNQSALAMIDGMDLDPALKALFE